MSDLTDKLQALASDLSAEGLPSIARRIDAILDAEQDETADPEGQPKGSEHGYGTESDCICGRNFSTVRGLREHLTKARRPSRPLRCASCGDRATTSVMLDGFRVPACLRHYNVWRTPDFDEVAAPAPVPDDEEQGPGWLTQEAKRARKRSATVPPHARPILKSPVPDDEAAAQMVDRMALAAFRVRYGREPVPESFDQSRLSDLHSRMEGAAPVVAEYTAAAVRGAEQRVRQEYENCDNEALRRNARHRQIVTEAWYEGYDAGDQDARAIQKNFPALTRNPWEQSK